MSEIITFAPITATGGAELTVPFPYLSQDHVKLYVNGVEDTDKTWTSDGAIVASADIASGDILVVKRETPRSALITELPATGTLKGSDVNEQSLQAVYVATEAADGLREGLALDEATETYWESAPTGANRIIKNVVDPSLDQEAATKGWYDTELATEVDNAATSASNAATSATDAAADAASATSSAATATTSGTNAATSEAAAAASEATAGSAETRASNAAAEAEAWANEDEDVVVTYDNPNPLQTPDAYSAKHWAAKTEISETLADSSNAVAQAAKAASVPYLASTLLRGEEGYAINWRTHTVAYRDYRPAASGGLGETLDISCKTFFETKVQIASAGMLAGNEAAQYGKNSSYLDWGTPHDYFSPYVLEETNETFGQFDSRGGRNFAGIPGSPGYTTFTSSVARLNLVSWAQGLSYGGRLLTRRNPVRMIPSTLNAEHYIETDLGRNTSTQIKANEPWTASVALQQPASNAQRYVVLRHYNNYDNLTYNAVIDMNDMSVVSNDFLWVRKITFKSNNWTRLDFGVPAPTGELTYNLSYLRILPANDSAGTTTYAGDGTSTTYVGYLGAYRGYGREFYNGDTNPADQPYYQCNFSAGGTALPDNTGLFRAGTLGEHTYFGHMYVYNRWMFSPGGGNNVIWDGGDASSFHYMRFRVLASTGDLYVQINDGVGPEPDVNGVFIPDFYDLCNDTDNNGLGTKFAYVWTVANDGADHTLYYRINDGPTQTASFSQTDHNDWSTAYWSRCFNSCFLSNTGGRILKYSGAYTRPVNLTEATRLLQY